MSTRRTRPLAWRLEALISATCIFGCTGRDDAQDAAPIPAPDSAGQPPHAVPTTPRPVLAPIPVHQPPVNAWPILPVDFAATQPLAAHAVLALRASPGAIVRGMKGGTITEVSTHPVDKISPSKVPTTGDFTVTITSSDGVLIHYIGLHEALVRPGFEIEPGAPIGVMRPLRESTLHLRATRGGEVIAPLTLLGR